jgi:uncharacterized protein with NRDE domain
MCTIFFANGIHPDYPLILLANRDEFYDRASMGLHHWTNTNLFAGKDLEQGGIWTGLTRSGNLGFITNYRDRSLFKDKAPSRGHLIKDFLLGDESPEDYIKSIIAESIKYNPYSIVIGQAHHLLYFSSVTQTFKVIEPGVHGLSNHLLDTPWLKVDKGRNTLKRLIVLEHFEISDLFKILDDEEKSHRHLPRDTGFTTEEEYTLSSTFISSKHYGTVFQTVILIDKNDCVTMIERRVGNTKTIEKNIHFKLEATR